VANYRGPEKKPAVQIHLLSLSPEATKELFVVAGRAEELLEQPVVANFSNSMLAIIVRQGPYNREAPFMYLYSLESSTYLGFLDLNRMLGVELFGKPANFVFLENT